MIRDNIIRADTWRGDQCRTLPVWQYDYGLTLLVEGIDLPTAYEVHFSDTAQTPAYTQIGTADGVAVPNELLRTGRNIVAHIYLHTGDADGETVKTIVIPVTPRAGISEETPTPAQEGAIAEAIEALNDGVERAEAAAETAEAAAAELIDFRALFDALGLSVVDGAINQTYMEVDA